MNRLTIIQNIAKAVNAKTYLEIGVNTGEVFFAVDVIMKIAVDPEFKFSRRANLHRVPVIKNLLTKNKELFFEETSDEFFAKHANVIETGKLDIAFIDGMHTYMQTYTDIVNSLKYLSPSGAIIVHDCNPTTAAAETPVKNSINEVLEKAKRGEIPGWAYIWNGDVWKAILRLQSERDDINICTLDVDWGVAVITRQANSSRLSYTTAEIEKLNYKDLEQNRLKWLNLKEPSYLNTLIQEIKR